MKYIALEDFAHEAAHVAQGDKLELSDKDAVHLIGLGRVAKYEEPKKADKPEKGEAKK
jgi:hypothetical protein